ncbi:MAG: hypothetical protein ABIH89_08635, partial [Elusimicrobiota bacterium]
LGAAGIPKYINFQGKLTDDAGQPKNGAFKFEFTLYDSATGGTQVWGTETHNSVTVSNGLYSVALGSYTAFSMTDFHQPLWLAVEVNDVALSPRYALTSSPYALSAVTVDNSTTGYIVLEQSVNPTENKEGRIQWDTDDNQLVIGTGTSTVVISPGSDDDNVSGDVDTGEIENGTILEEDLNEIGGPIDNQILSYDSASGGFDWINIDISSTTGQDWRMFYSDGSGFVSQMDLGAGGTVLTSNGTSAVPSFQSPGAVSDAETLDGKDSLYFVSTGTINQTILGAKTFYDAKVTNLLDVQNYMDNTVGVQVVISTHLYVNGRIKIEENCTIGENCEIKGVLNLNRTGGSSGIQGKGFGVHVNTNTIVQGNIYMTSNFLDTSYRPRYIYDDAANYSTGFSSHVHVNGNLTVDGDSMVGWHGSPTRIKILPSDFIVNDGTGMPVMVEDDMGGEISVRVGSSYDEMYAFVAIPTGYKATLARVYGSSDDTVTVYEGNITDGSTGASLGSANTGIEINITDTDSTSTNYLVIHVAVNDTTDVIYGGYVTIEKM